MFARADMEADPPSPDPPADRHEDETESSSESESDDQDDGVELRRGRLAHLPNDFFGIRNSMLEVHQSYGEVIEEAIASVEFMKAERRVVLRDLRRQYSALLPRRPPQPRVVDPAVAARRQAQQQALFEAHMPCRKPKLQLSSRIEIGTIIVLSINDPRTQQRRILNTYVICKRGKLTPVTIPAAFKNLMTFHLDTARTKSSTLYFPSNGMLPGRQHVITAVW